MPDVIPPLPPRTGSSAVLKVFVIGTLGMCLFIPLAMLWALVAERSSRRDEVVREVTASWGRAQTVGGIALDLPYDAVERRDNGVTQVVTRHAYAFPEQLAIEATLTPERRHRSIYSVVVYRTTLKITGTIAPPDLAALGADAVTVHRDRATTSVEIPDLRGTVSVSPLTWNGEPIVLQPMTDDGGVFMNGVRGATPIPGETSRAVPFALELTLAGSEALKFVPTGKATTAHVSAPWPDPGFTGAFLPTSQRVSASGFEARWQVSYLASGFPNSWLGTRLDRGSLIVQRANAAFGVNLVQAVDHYQQVERAVKYGLLFVLLTFTVFLLWELLRNLRLHPVQYLLIGAALIVFYLLLLSLSEQIGFAAAYGIAAAATVALVSAYAGAVLRAGVRGAAGIGLWLSALYGVLFVLLRLEDLALLVGSVFVFLVLAAVMFLTRRFDWSDMRSASEPV